jgi:surface protein
MKNYVLFGVLILVLNSVSALPFSALWNTTMPGSADDTIILPITGTYDVDWGDGTSNDSVDTHIYGSPGIYIVNISNFGITEFNFASISADSEKLISILQWGNLTFGPSNGQFKHCVNMNITALDIPDFTGTTTMEIMFQETDFSANLSAWDTSGITGMDGVFQYSTFNGDISGWDTSNVDNMAEMFDGDEYFNGDLSKWDTSSVTDMNAMFQDAVAFNGNISGWDTGSVTNMLNMFYGASTFNQDLNSWDTSQVTNMEGMFNLASDFNGDISSWDVSQVTTMFGMFSYATAFNGDLSYWGTGEVITMGMMFAFATSYNGDMSAWDVSKVEQMSDMFSSAYAFNQDIGAWNVTSVTDMSSMLDNTALSVANYDAILNGWAAQTVQNAVPFSANHAHYSAAGLVGRDVLETTYSWSMNDAGLYVASTPAYPHIDSAESPGKTGITALQGIFQLGAQIADRTLNPDLAVASIFAIGIALVSIAWIGSMRVRVF